MYYMTRTCPKGTQPVKTVHDSLSEMMAEAFTALREGSRILSVEMPG